MSILFSIIILAIMEVSLSFDNAVVNATVLHRMPVRMQNIFLTWGIMVSVFAVRLILPVFIVSLSSGICVLEVVTMALKSPEDYSASIQASHNIIAAFGSAFLLMVFLSFLFDNEREVHWIKSVEQKLASIGADAGIQIAITLIAIMAFHASLAAATVGIIAYIGIKTLGGTISNVHAAMAGISGFVYLECLDASFSLDGIVAAFAISSNIITIMIGLGLGSLVIRSLTVYLVRNNTLKELPYLEHGAHWSIGALGFLMLIGTKVNIPDYITGIVTVAIIGISAISSLYKEQE